MSLTISRAHVDAIVEQSRADCADPGTPAARRG